MLYYLIIILLIFIGYLYYSMRQQKENITDFKREEFFTKEVLKNIGPMEDIDKLNDKIVLISSNPTNQYLSFDKDNTLQSSYVNSKPTKYKLVKDNDSLLIESTSSPPHYLNVDMDGKIYMSFDKNNMCQSSNGDIECDNKWVFRTLNNKVLFKEFLRRKLKGIPITIIDKIKKSKSRLPKDMNESQLLVRLGNIIKKIYNNINSIDDLCNQGLSFVNSEVIKTYLSIELNTLCAEFKNLTNNSYFIQSSELNYFLTMHYGTVKGANFPTLNDLWKINYV